MQYLTPIIDRAIFFDNPEFSGAQISPDGQYISFLKPYEGVRNIWMINKNQSFDKAVPATSETHRPISQYYWSRDSNFLLYEQDNGGDENYHIYAVRVDEISQDRLPIAKDLTPFDQVRAILIKRSKLDHQKLLVGINNRDPRWHDLYEIQLESGEIKLLFENTLQLSEYHLDEKDQLSLGSRSLTDGSTELLQLSATGAERCYLSSAEESYAVIRFKNKQQVYMATNVGDRNLVSLAEFDFINLTETILESDPEGEVDLSNISYSDVDDKIVATSYTGAKNRIYWKEERYSRDYAHLCEVLDAEEISFTSGTSDEQEWIVYKGSDVDPGAAYYFNRTTRELRFLFRPRPELPVEALCEMKAVRYDSIDQLSIPAYITQPRISTSELAPAILLVHGGPWARDYWGYNSWVQFLANRGYVVVQINFRGSTGYGKSFLNAGNLEWGRRMQDDISAAAHFLIDNKLAHPDKIGIMGGSYGGYATLAGLAFTPDMYACGVCIVGPSNLFTLLESIPPYWESAREMFHNKMGNPNTEEGKKLLKERSPLFHSLSIKAPLLVAQGNNDPRVKTAESEQIVRAMRDHQLAVEYLNFPDEGHGFANPQNNMAFLAVAERFLSKHLGGRFQEEIPENLQDILSKVIMDIYKI